MIKALKTKVDNFSMLDAFVLTDNKEHLTQMVLYGTSV